MKKSKKIWICVGVILVVFTLGLFVWFFPKAKTGSEIAALLKPIITSENQAMDMHLKFVISGKETNIHTKTYWITEGEKSYLVMEQDGHPVYLVEDVLYLENGKAFLIQDAADTAEIKSIDAQMFAQIAALYEALEITTIKENDTETYSIEVSGEKAQELFGRIMPEIYKELSEIDNLRVDITAKEDMLTSVSYSGGAIVNGKEMALEVRIDNFKTLESGEYVIPEKIKSAIQNVNKEDLFSITEDLYRLMVAFADLASQETLQGKVTLSSNTGMINFKKTYDLAELGTSKNDLENADQIENLPEMIAFLCMEGDISCEEEVDGYCYTLKLNKNAMADITEMIIPDGVNQLIKLSKGHVEIVINGSKIQSMEIGIAGSLQSLFSKIQSQVGAEFVFE